ncbi:GIP, partial [Symbiodinium sp. CCMP2456]
TIPEHWHAKLAVVSYTIARVVANLTSAVLIGCDASVYVPMICDGLVRPVATGFGVCVLQHRFERLSEPSLNLWTPLALYCLASCHCDVAMLLWAKNARFVRGMLLLLISMYVWEVCCNAIQLQMTNLKLHALGLRRTARACQVLTTALLCGWVLFFVALAIVELCRGSNCNIARYIYSWTGLGFTRPLLGLLPGMVLLLLLQFLGLCVAAGRALSLGWHDAGVGHAACLLFVNSMLQLLGPVISVRGAIGFVDGHISTDSPQNTAEAAELMWLTLDISFQVLNVLLLSGLLGPEQWQNPMAAFEKLANLQGFGLASKRIAFSGQVNDNARDCIVSFPGKYSEEWDQAVQVATTQDAFSLACVFLTDRASGLGVHCDNPNAPGQCWCRAIYGHLPPSTYISVVDMRPEMQESQAPIDLEFKRADAKAMGQCLVIREEQHGELDWKLKLSDAEEDARARCAANRGRAPWGCRWFEDWRRNVHKAAELKQTLHVFYFRGLKGQGKMTWDELPSAEAKARVRQQSGLGASQTAEVAYLDKQGIAYVEHDIAEFQDLVCPPSPSRSGADASAVNP